MKDNGADFDFDAEAEWPRRLRCPENGSQVFLRWIIAATVGFCLVCGWTLVGWFTGVVVYESYKQITKL